MKKFIFKTSKTVTSRFLFAMFLCSIFFIQSTPTQAEEPHNEMVWVLIETQVNPYDGQLEFYGGGATPGWFGEERFEGTFLKYAVTETSFRIDDRWVDHEYEHHNVTIETYFAKPPLKMTPGETVELIYGFSHRGTAEDEGTWVQFWYDSEYVDIQPDTVSAYAPWAEDFDGTADGTYSFKVPPASSGGEIEIHASWWNAEPCLVIWKYQAQEVSGTTEVEAAPTQQQEEPAVEPNPTQDEESSNILVAGFVIGLIGDVYCTRNGIQQRLEKGDQVLLGCTITTGPSGRVRIRMNDMVVNGQWIDQTQPDYLDRIDDARNIFGADTESSFSPSYLNIGTNSEMFIETLEIYWGELHYAKGYFDLIKGYIKILFGREGKYGSSYSVKAGISVCGIRGSEVFIAYSPSDDLVYTQVLEGHMDVTSEATGETVSLTDNQSLVVTNGEIIDTGPTTQEQWDANLEEAGLRDEDFPDADIEEWEIITETTTGTDNVEDEIPVAQETRPPLAGYIFILCGVMICVGAIVVMLIIIYFVHKRSKQ